MLYIKSLGRPTPEQRALFSLYMHLSVWHASVWSYTYIHFILYTLCAYVIHTELGARYAQNNVRHSLSISIYLYPMLAYGVHINTLCFICCVYTLYIELGALDA